jgi:hypothetical protein
VERLLVNYWYASPVGHAVEGLRYALGYHAAEPGRRVSLLLNRATAVELAGCCSFLEETFAVEYDGFVEPDGDPRAALAPVPREWDRVVENHRTRQAPHDAFAGFRAFYDAAHEHFRSPHPTGITGEEPPSYAPHCQLRLRLPDAARAAAAETIGGGGPPIAVVLAGSSDARHLYPSLASWRRILSALAAQHPGRQLLLVGKLDADGRTTSRISRAEVDALLRDVPAAVDCFDRPLLEQAALIEASDLLVSPHTGIAFLASTVGTPWLALSGGNWHEYFFNGVPVYSLLPDWQRYPVFGWADLGSRPLPVIPDDDGDGPRTPSMSATRIREDLPELLEAADGLIAGRWTEDELLAAYFPRLLDAYGGDRRKLFSFDNVHERYLSARAG